MGIGANVMREEAGVRWNSIPRPGMWGPPSAWEITMVSRGKHKPFLGVSFGPRTLVISEVLPNAPADLAKFRKGQMVAEINGTRINSVREFSAALRRANKVMLKGASRVRRVSVGSVNLGSQTTVTALLFGKGDKVGASGFRSFMHCDDRCDCADGGMGCDRWYTLEGEGENGGILMTIHCKTYFYDSAKGKTETTEKTRGPLEYF